MGYDLAKMRSLEQVESDVRMLPPEKQEELRDWLENLLEDQLELTDEFRAKIERGELDIREGRSRVRKP
jgi:predicted ribonuclease YlaK